MSQRLKFILATNDKLVILNSKDGQVENQVDLDDGVDRSMPIKLVSIPAGVAIVNKNKIIGKKFASSGRVDSTYQPCETISNLVDIAYSDANPAQMFALSEVSNELILF